jgi:hypothetical protein
MPLIQLKKVNRAVRAFKKVVVASNEFQDSMNELNKEEEQEFTRITGAKLEPIDYANLPKGEKTNV